MKRRLFVLVATVTVAAAVMTVVVATPGPETTLATTLAATETMPGEA
jgi:hypothetical protein